MPLKPKGRIRWAVLALALAVTGGMPAAAGASPAKREVIVQMEAGRSADQVQALVRRSGGEVTGRLPIINGFAARVPAREVRAVKRASGVRAVTRNGRIEPQSIREGTIQPAYPFAVGANSAWNHNTSPVTGKGVGVAVIDTGIAGAMPDFRVSASNPASRVVASALVHPGAVKAGDSYGHGTHVAGIIAGNGFNRGSLDPLLGRYVGVAPNANLIDVKVSDELGNSTILDVIYGLQFVVDHKDVLGIRVVNLSLESTVPGSYKTDPLNAAVEAAWFKGLVVVAAAGNRGTATDAVHYAPGNDPYVISVGAVDDQATNGGGDDQMTGWSSRGTTQDGIAKPELHAPGSRIVSTLAPGSAYTAQCPTCIVDLEMFRAGGTSMSAPVVSGIAALLLEKYPNLTPDEVKGTLVKSARVLPNGRLEAAINNALAYLATNPPVKANVGLTPHTLVNPVSGEIDYTRSSWSRSSWSSASGDGAANWARSSWSRSSWSSTDSAGVETSRSSWSRSSWSTSWAK